MARERTGRGASVAWIVVGVLAAAALLALVVAKAADHRADSARSRVVDALEVPDGWTLRFTDTRSAGSDGIFSGFDVRPLNSTMLEYELDVMPGDPSTLTALLADASWTLADGQLYGDPAPARCDEMPADGYPGYSDTCLAYATVDGFDVDVWVGATFAEGGGLANPRARITVSVHGAGYRPSGGY